MKATGFLAMLLAAGLTTACGGDREPNQTAQKDAAASPAGAGGAVGTSGAGAADIRDADREFVREITAANTAELTMAKLALQRASNANVKKFAQMMVDDHTRAGEKLQSIVSQHHLGMREAGEAEKNPAQELGERRGADFDRAYAEAMVDAHQDLVDQLEARIDKDNLAKWKEGHANPATGKKAKGEAMTVVAEKSDNAVTSALNMWAAETYPVAFAHLQAAKDMQKGVSRSRTNP